MSEVLCQARRSIKGSDGEWKGAGDELILPRADAERLRARGSVVILDADEPAPAPASAPEPKGKSTGKGGAKPPAE